MTEWMGPMGVIVIGTLVISAIMRRGLQRVEHHALNKIPWLRPITLIGCGMGAFVAYVLDPDLATVSIIDVTLILLGGLLLAMAYTDVKTFWAPLEAQSLLAIGLGIVSGNCTTPSMIDFAWAGMLGLGLLGLAHGLWFVQTKCRIQLMPPVDMVAVVAPLCLFGASITSLVLYLTVALVLVCLQAGNRSLKHALPAHGKRTATMVQDDGIGRNLPALGILLPVMLLFMLGRAWYGEFG